MDEIMGIAEENGLKVLEDSAQAHGAEYKGKKVGSIGDCSAFSFYATKNMVTGEGGMVTTNNKKIAEKIKKLRDHGRTKNYEHDELGFNLRMTDIQAAIGIEQLRKLDEFNKKRRKNAEFLTKNLDGLVKTPFISKGVKHVFHQYTIKTKNRNKLLKKLHKNKIGAKVYYSKPIHKQPLYKKMGYNDNLPVSETISKKVLSLPVHPKLKKHDLEKIVKTIGGQL